MVVGSVLGALGGQKYRCPKKIVPFSKIFLWAPDVILESFIYQKLGNKSKFFFCLTKIQYGRIDLKLSPKVALNCDNGRCLFRTRCIVP